MFYISWGKKTFQRTEGMAVDFCGICRRPTAIEVRQIRSQNHVYDIGFGKGEVVGRSCRCMTCGSEWAMQAGTVTTSLNAVGPLSIETLISETFPRLPLIHAERLEQEAAIARDPFSLSEEARISLLAEPFFILDNDVRRNEDKTGGLQILGGLGCLGALGVGITSLVFFLNGSVWGGLLWLIVTVGLFWGAMRLYNLATDRFMQKTIYPRLASSLAPLLPSSDELAGIVTGLRAQSKCARDTNLKRFLPVLLAASSPIEEAHAARQKQAQAAR